MIVQISGTGGSGKTTIARQVHEHYPIKEPINVEGAKRPIGYTMRRPEGKNLFVPGHYETPCGGADTLSKYPKYLDFIYELINEAAKQDQDILYEGLLVESDTNRCGQLHKDGFPLVVLVLDTPVEVCIQDTYKRRHARGNFKPMKEKNTISRWRHCRNRMRRLQEMGVDCRYVSRVQAYVECINLFGLKPASVT